MLEQVVIAGFGGQGVMFIGKLYATLAAEKYQYVTYFPSYGSEVRGGTAHCNVIISDEEIASPLVEQADSLIVMNQMSADRFRSRVKPDGLAIINSSLVSADGFVDAVEVPATQIAAELGDVRVANIVMLGAYLKRKPILELDAVSGALAKALGAKRPQLAALNAQALKKGYNL